MRNFLAQLLGLPATADRWLRLIHARISGIFLAFAIYLLTLGPLFNIIGLKGLNLIPLFVFVAVWTIAIFHPRALGLLLVSNLPVNPKNWDREKLVKDAGDLLAKIFGEIGIWPVSILLFLGTISASNKPSAVWIIYAAAMVLMLYTVRYGKSGKFFKRLAYGYALVIIILSLISLAPAHYQIKYFGIDLSSELAASDQEKAVSEAEKAVAESEQDTAKKKLREIAKRAKEGKLTDEDKKYLNQLIRERDDNTLVRKISSSAGSLTESVIEGIKILRSPSAQVAVVPTSAPSYSSAPLAPALAPQSFYKTSEKDYSGYYEICWARREGESLSQCIRPYIIAKGDKLTADYSFRDGNARMKFCGSEKKPGNYEGNFSYNGVGGNFIRGFGINLEDFSGYMVNSAGKPTELRIKKLS